MKPIIKTLLVSVGVLALLAGGGYYVITQSNVGGNEITKVANDIEQREDTDVSTEQTSDNEEFDDTDADMKESTVQINMHRMTHQKIKASKKTGVIEMTPANIEGLLVIVRANANHYEHAEFYEAALMNWQKGDFSNAVTVHNTIWDWHNGTVGRATGLMNEEEEREFVEKHFR